MVSLRNSAEGGTAGTTVSTGNSGGSSGDAFTTVTIGGASVCRYSTTSPAHGTKSIEMQTISGQNVYLEWLFTATNLIAYRGYWTFPAAFDSSTRLVFAGTGGGSDILGLNVSNSHRLILVINSVTIFTSTAALPTNTKIRFEVTYNRSTGAYFVAYYLGDSLTPVQSLSGTAASNNANTITWVRVGRSSGSVLAKTFYLDDQAVETGSTTPIGPYPFGLALGDNKLLDLRIGDNAVLKLYEGDTLRWTRP